MSRPLFRSVWISLSIPRTAFRLLSLLSLLALLLAFTGMAQAQERTFPASAPYRAWQGVATDGSRIYLSTDRNERFELENILSVHDLEGRMVRELRNAYTGKDSGGRFLSFGNLTVEGSRLWATVYNFNAGPPILESRVVAFSLPELRPVAEYPIGDGCAEGLARHDGAWWVCYHDRPLLRRFDDDFHPTGEYTLPRTFGPEGGYQGLFWIGQDLYLNLHGCNKPGGEWSPGLDRLHFDGSHFTFVARYRPPTYGSGQGVSLRDGRIYWADRVANQIVITPFTGLTPR